MPVDKTDHAQLLRDALARAGLDKDDLALKLGVSARTVNNWTSRTSPTLPSEKDRGRLRSELGRYDMPGDPVEVAVRSSQLVEWRQDAVISEYKRHLYQQREERTG